MAYKSYCQFCLCEVSSLRLRKIKVVVSELDKKASWKTRFTYMRSICPECLKILRRDGIYFKV
jgi:hypothetical protein